MFNIKLQLQNRELPEATDFLPDQENLGDT